jgi:hypothetical protein
MTSIEYLFKELWETSKDKLEWNSILEKAKEMHKKEIEQSFIDGRFSGCGCFQYMKETDPEKYYKQVFKI